MKINNRTRILTESIELFNRDGVVPVTTNHICQHLKISPGNFYFHFKNRETVLRELFKAMTEETYALWKAELHGEETLTPIKFIEDSLEIFWKYRFFHREMYFIRRQDPELSKLWHQHLGKTRHFMKQAYAIWVKKGWMHPIRDAATLRSVSDMVLITASSFFQFYEGVDKPATRRPLTLATDYLIHFLEPHLTESYLAEIGKAKVPQLVN